jgi:hypothetical protein
MLLHFLRNIVRKFCGRILGVLPFAFLCDVVLRLLRRFRIFYVVPTMVDLVLANARSRFRSVLGSAFNVWRNESELIAFML